MRHTRVAPIVLVASLWTLPCAGQPPSTPAAGAEERPRVMTVDAWREDLRALVDYVATKHRAPWAHVTEPAFRRAAADLDARIPELSDSRIVVEMAAIVALPQDGHSRLSLPLSAGEGQQRAHLPTAPPAETGLLLRAYPVGLYRFSDGLFVQAATTEHLGLVGARVIRLGPLAADAALDAVRRYVNADNEPGHALSGPRLLGLADICGAIGAAGPDGRLSLTIEEAAGRVTSVVLDPLEPGVTPALVLAHQRPGVTASLALRDTSVRHRMEYLAGHRALFVQINAIADAPGRSLAAFAADVAAFVRTHDVARVVLDLRWNGGGNNYLNRGVILALTGLPEINQPGHLYTLVGRYTFSAAMNLVSQLEQWTHTIFVGEPTGATPSHYGDAKRYVLPRSGLTVRLSSVYWRDWSVDENRKAVDPELSVAPSSHDYFAGRDAALDAALAHREPDAVPAQLLGAFDRGGIEAAARRLHLLSSDPRAAARDLFDDLRVVGRTLAGRGRTAEAVQVFRQNLASRPASFDANADLGEALVADGKRRDAVPYLERALAIKPDLRLQGMLDAARK